MKFRIAVISSALIGALSFSATAPAVAADDVQVAFSPNGGAEALVLKTINSARSSIRVLAYSFTAPPVVKALLAAKHRGVDVAVTVDYKNNIEQDRSGKAAAALNALSYAGVPVRVVRVFPIQHSKLIVIDQATVETGSYNYSQAAARVNSENVLVISNRPDIARAYLANWSEVTALGEAYRAP